MIRQKKLQFENLSLLHFDAHPDLAFPIDIDANIIFQPRELYDQLDASEAGIASFIIPLVYAGHVDHLIWIKPHWAEQVHLKLFFLI